MGFLPLAQTGTGWHSQPAPAFKWGGEYPPSIPKPSAPYLVCHPHTNREPLPFSDRWWPLVGDNPARYGTDLAPGFLGVRKPGLDIRK